MKGAEIGENSSKRQTKTSQFTKMEPFDSFPLLFWYVLSSMSIENDPFYKELSNAQQFLALFKTSFALPILLFIEYQYLFHP